MDPTGVFSGMADVDMMVTRTAVPMDPATCRNVLFMAVPCGIRSLGSWFRAKVVIGIMTMAMEIIRMAFMLARYVKLVSMDKFVKANVVTPNKKSPPRASHFPPNLSKRYPVIGFISPMMMAPGKEYKP